MQFSLETQSQNPFSLIEAASCPSKIFLIGEYLALEEKKAIVSCGGPRFQLERSLQPKESLWLHSESPAGKLAGEQGIAIQSAYYFWDPYYGEGGLGASSAQFLFVSALNQGLSLESWSIRNSFQGASSSGVKPSGYDGIAQYCGGTVCIQAESKVINSLPDTALKEAVLVFRATHRKSNKVQTHLHLKKYSRLREDDQAELEAIVSQYEEALIHGDVLRLAQASSNYANVLNRLGYESQCAWETRKQIESLPGVRGVKGSGALLNDVFLVYVDGSPTQKQNLMVQIASEMDLKPIEGFFQDQRGLVGK